MGKHFVISGFGQAAYFGSHVQATYFDLDLAVNVDYRDSDRDPLVTVGPQIDYVLAKGVRIAIRPGKNFGKNLAAETVGGLSIVGTFVGTTVKNRWQSITSVEYFEVQKPSYCNKLWPRIAT